ncbi:MAG: hypothetical protein GKR91_06555 [Pseudomonadales bacterium]|nr:hypothetical protein [Pseudomonadales bacterium]
MKTNYVDESNFAFTLGFRVGWYKTLVFRKLSITACILIFSLSLISYTSPAAAIEVAHYDSDDLTLTIPNVNVSNQSAYQVELVLSQTEPSLIFDLTEAEEIGWTEEAYANFSLESGMLDVPNLYVGAQKWNVTLELIPESLQFRAVTATPVNDVSVIESNNGESIPFIVSLGNDQLIPFLEPTGELLRIDYIFNRNSYQLNSSRNVSYRFDLDGKLECVGTNVSSSYYDISFRFDSGSFRLESGNCNQTSNSSSIEGPISYMNGTDVIDTVAIRRLYDDIVGPFNAGSSGEGSDLLFGQDTERNTVYALLYAVSRATTVYTCAKTVEGGNGWVSYETACE